MDIFYFNLPILFLIVVQNVASNGVKVKVEQGWLEGEKLDLVTRDGQYYSFKGVPYARPPNGTWRFKAPQPPLSWSGVRSAKQHGSVCPQWDKFTNKLYTSSSEDCLFVNIYSPNLNPRSLQHVIVFVHGGAYKSGSSNVDFFGPDFMLLKGLVVVTFNYRLDSLGFICLGTKEVPGNAGLKDQVACLKWVQKNIKHFGGDPDRVTIMGQSAGSASVGLHIRSPMSKGLFHRAIALSGSPFCDWGLPFQPERRAKVLAKQLGCKTEIPYELLECLQSVPLDKLINTRPNILSFEEYTYNAIKMYQFVPVPEKYSEKDNFLSHSIFEEPTYLNEVDIMFGHTNEELITLIKAIRPTLIQQYDKYPEQFVPRKILNQLGPSLILELSDIIRKYYFGNKSVDVNSTREFLRYGNDATFVYDIFRYFLSLPEISNTKRYAYQFSITSSRNFFGLQGEKYGIFGAAHLDDLMYLFDPKAMNLVSDKNSTEFKLIDQITTIFTDFAKYGDPYHSSGGQVWPTFNICYKQYMDLTNNGPDITATVKSLHDNDSYKFWEQLYSSIERCTSNNFHNFGANEESHCFD